MFNLLALQLDGLEWAYLIVGILLVLVVVATLVVQIIVVVGYWKGNRTTNSLGMTGGKFARKLLDENGMPEVQVRECTFLRMWFFGNHYSISKRTVFLRALTINKTSVTSVALAAQKVALAEQHRDGVKSMIVRSRLQAFGIFSPTLFLPLVIAGLLVDLFVTESFICTLIAFIVGVVFIFFSLLTTLLNIPVERRANKRAEEMLAQVLTDEENEQVHKIFRSYMMQYVMQFVVAVLRILQLILKALLKMRANQKK